MYRSVQNYRPGSEGSVGGIPIAQHISIGPFGSSVPDFKSVSAEFMFIDGFNVG